MVCSVYMCYGSGLSTSNLYDLTLKQVCSAQHMELSKLKCVCVVAFNPHGRGGENCSSLY